MRILIDKQLQPQVAPKIAGVKSMEQYQFGGYNQDQSILIAPSVDVTLNVAVDIARVGARVEQYEYFVEVPNANLGDNLPSGLSYETYDDPDLGTVTRTWGDLDRFGDVDNQAGTDSLDILIQQITVSFL